MGLEKCVEGKEEKTGRPPRRGHGVGFIEEQTLGLEPGHPFHFHESFPL